MSWSRFDDRYDDNRKIKRAWRRHPRAVGLHAMAITYSSRHETDGYVDLDWLDEKLPNAKERERVIAVLVECELLEAVDGERFLVHDYLDFNPSQQQLAEKRARDADRQRSRRGIHSVSTRSPNGHTSDAHELSQRSPDAPAQPVPSQPGDTRDQRG